MTCPVCGGVTRITDSRGNVESVRRRRQCQECGHRFTTIEVEVDLLRKLEKIKEAPSE